MEESFFILVCKASLAFRNERLDVAITVISFFEVTKMNIWLQIVSFNRYKENLLDNVLYSDDVTN